MGSGFFHGFAITFSQYPTAADDHVLELTARCPGCGQLFQYTHTVLDSRLCGASYWVLEVERKLKDFSLDLQDHLAMQHPEDA